MKLQKPKFWHYKKISFFSLILLPFTILIFFKNFFIKKKGHKFDKIKTICVGNIYLGGTGKTPFTIKLNKIIKKLKFKTAIIKKYYKSQIDEQKLIIKEDKLYCYGDRVTSLKKAIKNKKKIALFDDGLQDKSIKYDISFVCFNTDSWIGNGFLLPAGPLRETLNSLKNYDSVVLNGNGEDTKHIRNIIKKYNSGIKIFETQYIPTNIKKFKNNKKYLIFSGIGNPKTFEKTLLINKIKITKSIVFPDHYQYTDKNIKKIKKTAEILNSKILTTEKDYMRLSNNNKKNIDYIKIKLVVKNEKNLINFLRINL